ncbi:rho GTPase activator [Blastomyces dermatitidis ATCC 18188]|uniref:Rho GTPase activator n=1 Tax=Ajellomyces dermatitidis (strain ATCC 18188 / CBS 674.68) TaxID=653446 RepID=F2TH27_AJEDA|nr:rho GTPase activator [Blastomyces dermatitidis ATCC 18188]
MATGDSHPAPGVPARDLPRSTAHQQQNSVPHGTISPPSKRDLTSWWKQFVRNTKKDGEPGQQTGIFGVPLNVSIKYANVAISLAGEDGSSFIYGYVPIVVAKCGVFLKEKATDVEGIFRLSGSAKRIKDLQEAFDSPDRFGKGLDWTGYTVHDAANILRRYLNQLPEPIVPLDFYERFRDPLRKYQAQAVEEKDAAPANEEEPFDHAKAVVTYQQLIKELPPLNRQLLLYILDLLTVFASKSEVNRMTAANLAAIFQPGLLSHPAHDMAPKEYKLSQDVLIFLIENQDNFLFGMTGTAADPQTVKAMQAGNATNSTLSNLRRSTSNASGKADSIRKIDALRRNVSVSSKHSKTSNFDSASPSTPNSAGGGSLGVHRSNTVPSKKLAAVSPTRFTRPRESSGPGSGHLSPSARSRPQSRSPSQTPSLKVQGAPDKTIPESPSRLNTNHGLGLVQSNMPSPLGSPDEQAVPFELGSKPGTQPLAGTFTKERKLASLFKSTPPEGDRKDGRQPNRLRKKRPVPGSASESARSSSHSLQVGSEPSLSTLVSQAVADKREAPEDQSHMWTPKLTNSATTPAAETIPQPTGELKQAVHASPESTLKPGRSRTPSMHSRSSVTDHSDFDHQDDSTIQKKKDHRRSWRHPRGVKRRERTDMSMSPPPPIGYNSNAAFSSSSLGSTNWPQKTASNESRQISPETSATGTIDSTTTTTQPPPSLTTQDSSISVSSNLVKPSNYGHQSKEPVESERKGFFGKFKAKVAGVKEGVKEREVEREREYAKSPPLSDGEKTSSRHNLSILPPKESRESKESKGTTLTEPPTEPRVTRPAEIPESSQPPVTAAAAATRAAAPPTPQPSPPLTMVFPGSFPEPTIPEETPPWPVTEAPKDSGVTVLPKVEEDESQSPPQPSPSTAETVKVAPAPQLGTVVENQQSSPEPSSTTSMSNA